MNLSNYQEPVFSILPPIPDDLRWLFLIVMAIFVVAIIWHAHRQHRGW